MSIEGNFFREKGLSITNFNLTGKLLLLLTVQMLSNQIATKPKI